MNVRDEDRVRRAVSRRLAKEEGEVWTGALTTAEKRLINMVFEEMSGLQNCPT